MNRRGFFSAMGVGLGASLASFVPAVEPPKRRKRIITVACYGDGERIAMAKDGDIIRVEQPDKIKLFDIGADHFSYDAGNLDALTGRVRFRGHRCRIPLEKV